MPSSKIRRLTALLVLACLALAATASAAGARTTNADVRKGLEGLVTSPGGPPGAIATLYKNGKLTTISAGRADIESAAKPRATEHMRIASVAKAFSGAVALHLVGEGRLKLSDTVGELVQGLPASWSPVTVAELLHHTSGLPDYTKSKGFEQQVGTNPHGFVKPMQVIGWVRSDPLNFAAGKKYEYSNTDNIVIGLIVEAVTGRTYNDELQRIVFGPAKLPQTELATKVAMPKPFIHGYFAATETKGAQDVSEFLNPSGAWASGAIVSTPEELNAFIRADLGLKFFGATQQREQMDWWVGGESSPPGPGKNSAGLALFRYQSKCGTVYGHTGNFPGYVQLAAATANGKRALTTTLNIPAPTGKLLAQLRHVQAEAVCALMGK
ncbi:MAG: beta-lactamase family protein [Actinobacteria bacterium]|nr:beta-lactamase family protein [Actinomycetota bacterium]